ncbi:MAG: hypothetical protein JHD16_12910 [Solirubrobacteraceae bacterium]|nr:hypothetical protein [Solirubrobacteraceae bacterium]
MPDRRHLRLTTATTALGLAAIAAGLGATSATAATTRTLPADINKLPRGGVIEYGVASIKLTGGASGKLKSAGTSLSGSGSADVKGSTIEFQGLGESGPLDVTRMVGAAGVEGGFTAKGSKGSVKVSQIVFQPGLEKNVVAKVGSKLVELGTLKGGKATFSRQADGLLKGAKLSLSSKGAKALNAKTGGGFSAGSFGTVNLEYTTRELPLKGGVATMTLAPGLLETLTANGLDVTAEAPAARAGNVVTIQLTAGAFDPENVTGRLQLEGKVTVGKPGQSTNLFGWRGVVNSKQKELFANINENVAAVVADVDVTGFTANFEGSSFVARGVKLSLSKIASSTIKQQFGVDVAAGTPMGTVEMTGQLSGE